MDENQLLTVQQYLETATGNLNAAKKLLSEMTGTEVVTEPGQTAAATKLQNPTMTPQGKVIEGVFDGQNMIGPDGKVYSVPANYASKSKLVEGDVMKLTIAPDGSFIYKQIGPIERERIVGVLSQDEETDRYHVLANNHAYKILLASVTYFKGEVGDEAIILKPKGSESQWAAVENIIKPLPGQVRKNQIETSDKPAPEETGEGAVADTLENPDVAEEATPEEPEAATEMNSSAGVADEPTAEEPMPTENSAEEAPKREDQQDQLEEI